MPDTDQPTARLFAALVRAQAHARAAELDGENKHHGYRYATAESLIQEGRSSLTAAGLALIVTDVELEHRIVTIPSENGSTGEVTTRSVLQPMLRATYVLAHESGESISYRRQWPCVEQKGRPIDKAEGGALTTALGYAIRDVLCLPRDDQYADMDRRDDREHEPQRPQQAPPRAPERPAEKPTEGASLADSGQAWDALLAAMKRGEPIADRQELAVLTADGRASMAYVERAYRAESDGDFGKLGAEVKGSALSSAWKDIVLAEMKTAWRVFKAGAAERRVA